MNPRISYKRAMKAALWIRSVHCAALVSPIVFTSKQVPRYPAKVRIRFAPNVIAGICCTALFGLRAENRRRDHVITRLGVCISRVFVRRISCLATIIADFRRVQLHLGIEYLDTNLSG